MKNLVIYIHGKGGCAEEKEHYEPLFPDCDVIGWDYKSQDVMEAADEFPKLYDMCSQGYGSVSVVANSIGAFYTMSALSAKNIYHAYFISPIVNMEKLIRDMMLTLGTDEEELKREKTITTGQGEVLSWEYLCYVRSHPIRWNKPCDILYGDKDNLTSLETVSEFAKEIGAALTVMEGGEHWFHTDEQMKFLDGWIEKSLLGAQ